MVTFFVVLENSGEEAVMRTSLKPDKNTIRHKHEDGDSTGEVEEIIRLGSGVDVEVASRTLEDGWDCQSYTTIVSVSLVMAGFC